MEKWKLGDKQRQMADLIWDNEPLSSRELVELCADCFDWKRTTTYTMLKILCEAPSPVTHRTASTMASFTLGASAPWQRITAPR